ncbi:hypothetical protein GH741_03765 [Aquibacillus halophilus]|uniref:Uncharacterized protein n=1 Tax=Aquibacillus halophilus TaxID=930132 RepID=A0A6A8D875_9BACI|nr:hypothetical protein [Aquibacillus halophilus]MRH41788.1 hypothetical protein [Aquibacillus halophilus]
MFSQQIAIKLEIVAKRALNIQDKDGMAGVVSTNFIENEKGAFTVLCTALAPYYLNATKEERIPLDSIIERYRHLQDCGIEEYFKSTDRAAEELTLLLNHLGVWSPKSD